MKSILALIPYLAALLIPLSPFAAESARILIVVGPPTIRRARTKSLRARA